MANNRFNKQVTPKGYKMGGRVKKMGGGMMMMKKPMMKKGGEVKSMKKDPIADYVRTVKDIKKPKGAKVMAKSLVKKKAGGSVSSKGVKAPAGFHWMKAGTGFKLMKNPPSGYKKHPGSSLVAKFKIQKVHKK